jgi:hypothetical protein
MNVDVICVQAAKLDLAAQEAGGHQIVFRGELTWRHRFRIVEYLAEVSLVALDLILP